MSNLISGGCLWGDIRFQAKAPRNVHSCSCDICQKQTGAQTLVWLEFAAENVEWVGKGGKPATYRSSNHSSRAFCSLCGSSLGAIDDEPTVALLTGVMDDPAQLELPLEYHSFVDLAPAWWRHLISYEQ